MQSIQRGALVRLVSGGPVMSVQGISPNGDIALCAWFDSAALRSEHFATASLLRVPGGDHLQSVAPLFMPTQSTGL